MSQRISVTARKIQTDKRLAWLKQLGECFLFGGPFRSSALWLQVTRLGLGRAVSACSYQLLRPYYPRPAYIVPCWTLWLWGDGTQRLDPSTSGSGLAGNRHTICVNPQSFLPEPLRVCSAAWAGGQPLSETRASPLHNEELTPPHRLF